MSRFTVDTHLFRELGEFLVGRDSTALVELVKNAYDADATRVTVHAENLADPANGFIQVSDNGLGMTSDQFEEGFLRIASRIKETPTRISPSLYRRYTGSKGIGRLAAHKLAKYLEIHSVVLDHHTRRPKSAFTATIDWSLVEQATILDDVVDEAVQIMPFEPSSDAEGGTVLILRNLRRRWTAEEKRHFVREMRSTTPPEFLTDPPRGRLLADTLLFDNIFAHSAVSVGDWSIDLTGEFDAGDEYLEIIADAAAWVLEVDATDSFPRFGIAPTVMYANQHADARPVVRTLEMSTPEGYPHFTARALIREGDWSASGGYGIKQWRRNASGILIYLEGFRVLPYAEPGNDWLDLDRLYAGRYRSGALAEGLFDDAQDKDSMLSTLPARSYFGGAFLTLESAGRLQLLINREGFLPDEHFFHLQRTLKTATAFATRVRSAAKVAPRGQRQRDRLESAAKRFEEVSRPESPARLLERAAESGAHLLREARTALAAGDAEVAAQHVAAAERAFAKAPESAREIRDQQAMVFALASLGTQMAAFVHEIHGLLALATAVEVSLSHFANHLELFDRGSIQRMARLSAAVAELRLGLERQSAYLTDVAAGDARRRRSRQSLAERFKAAVELVAHHAEKRHIRITNHIDIEAKSPPMFRAEITAIFSNLLTNAIKAAGQRGLIQATSHRDSNGALIIRIENTGVAVMPEDGEAWFRPFTSSTADVDPALGKGMGLGLPITRRMLAEYGAEIRFAEPREGFATCVEILWPG